MQAFEEQREPDGLDIFDERAEADAGPADDEGGGLPALTEGFVHDVLATMALRSKRRQADLDAALWCAGVAAGRDRRLAAMERLREQGCVDKVVVLSDGGVLLSVTALGLDRLGSARS